MEARPDGHHVEGADKQNLDFHGPKTENADVTVVRWLHLSDFHFDARMHSDSYDINKVVSLLLQKIRHQRQSEGKLDFIFITGDLGNTGKPGDYKACAKFLDELLTAAELTPEDLWLVPGNHDVSRPAGKRLQRTLENAEDADEFFGDPQSRQQHLMKFESFLQFLQGYFPNRTMAESDAVHEPQVRRVGQINIGILPLNSAWFCQDDYDKGQIWIGSRLVRERVERLRSGHADIIVALLHHPFAYLHENEDVQNWMWRECDVILRGHLHEPAVESIMTPSGQALQVAAGATYQGSRWPCRAFFATLNPELYSLRLDPIQYLDSAGADSWVVDPGVFPNRHNRLYSGDFALARQASKTKPERAVDVKSRQANFPHPDWTAVNRASWLSSIVDWFRDAYQLNPVSTMDQLLTHVFAILTNAGAQRNLSEIVIILGAMLQPCLPQNLPSDRLHHRSILQLLEFGINRNLSHLFMLPSVNRKDLLEIPDYCRLLLATRYLASGDYTRAIDLAQQVGEGCCVALYVIGQSYRKQENNLEKARIKLQEVNAILEKIEVEGTAYRCTVTSHLECLCNPHLLRASVERALGVVARRLAGYAAQNDNVTTEMHYKGKVGAHFEKAVKAAKKAIEVGEPTKESLNNELTLQPTYDQTPQRVLGDVDFSYGYYLYEGDELDQAASLFESAIKVLSETGQEWSAPYTRLGIICLIQKRNQEAKDLLLQARSICERTSAKFDREAPISLALCTLGLKVLEQLGREPLLDADTNPLAELEIALGLEPALARGPLVCHRNDALKLLSCCPEEMRSVVEIFIDACNAEVNARPAS